MNFFLIFHSFFSENDLSRLLDLIALVKCLSSLCCIKAVTTYLETAQSYKLFDSLISFVARCSANPSLSRFRIKWSHELEDATIDLICK